MIVWTPGMSLAELERQVILAAYRHYRENKTAAAGALGISPRTLYEKLQQYEQEDAERAAADTERAAADRAFLARARGSHHNAPESLVLWPPGVADAMRALPVDTPDAAQNAGEGAGTPAAAQASPTAPAAPAGAPGPASAPQAPQAPARAAYGRGR